MNKIILNIVLLFVFACAACAQPTVDFKTLEEGKVKELPSLAIGFGVLAIDGDIGEALGISSFGKIKGGFSLTVEQRIEKMIGVSLSATFGKVADSENGKIGAKNFESKITQLDLNVLFHFDNDFMFARKSEFAPYISAGIGFLKFDPHTDLKDKNGIQYNYWNDGTIRDIAENSSSSANAKFINRDFKFETQLKDSTTNYKRTSLAIPLGVGANLKLSKKISVNIGATYYIVLTDWLDNRKNGANDKYIFAYTSIKVLFGKKDVDNSAARYQGVDFKAIDAIDSDQDGVADDVDRCSGTPNIAKVDSKGCPLDDDDDGVPDYKDKEKETKRGSLVDESGKTISEQMLIERQNLWDSIATERKQLFSENPSMKFLKGIDSKNIKNPNKFNKLPAVFKPADMDLNGSISSEEVIEAISQLFDGETAFTFETINDLITYFFEQ